MMEQVLYKQAKKRIPIERKDFFKLTRLSSSKLIFNRFEYGSNTNISSERELLFNDEDEDGEEFVLV
jgi:hypothetical protein